MWCPRIYIFFFNLKTEEGYFLLVSVKPGTRIFCQKKIFPRISTGPCLNHWTESTEFGAPNMEIPRSENANLALKNCSKLTAQNSALRKCKFHTKNLRVMCSESANFVLKNCNGAQSRPPRILRSENDVLKKWKF